MNKNQVSQPQIFFFLILETKSSFLLGDGILKHSSFSKQRPTVILKPNCAENHLRSVSSRRILPPARCSAGGSALRQPDAARSAPITSCCLQGPGVSQLQLHPGPAQLQGAPPQSGVPVAQGLQPLGQLISRDESNGISR